MSHYQRVYFTLLNEKVNAKTVVSYQQYLVCTHPAILNYVFKDLRISHSNKTMYRRISIIVVIFLRIIINFEVYKLE